MSASQDDQDMHDEYQRTDAQVTAYVKELAGMTKALVSFAVLSGKLTPGARYVAKGSEVHCDPAAVKGVTRHYLSMLEDIKPIVKAARKRPRQKLRRESFGGVFRPVYIGEALRRFINEAPQDAFGTYEGQYVKDLLPNMQEGYCLHNGLQYVLHRYVQEQNLGVGNRIVLDQHMADCFAGDIAPSFYLVPTGTKERKPKTDKNGKVITKEDKIISEKRIMDSAGEQYRNIFEALSVGYKDKILKDGSFPMYYLQSIVNVEEYGQALCAQMAARYAEGAAAEQLNLDALQREGGSRSDIAAVQAQIEQLTAAAEQWNQIADNLQDAKLRAALLAEHDMLKSINTAVNLERKAAKKAARPVKPRAGRGTKA